MPSESFHPPVSTDLELVTEAILDAAGWARVGITVSDERLRLQAAKELALTIVQRLDQRDVFDPRQMSLFG